MQSSLATHELTRTIKYTMQNSILTEVFAKKQVSKLPVVDSWRVSNIFSYFELSVCLFFLFHSYIMFLIASVVVVIAIRNAERDGTKAAHGNWPGNAAVNAHQLALPSFPRNRCRGANSILKMLFRTQKTRFMPCPCNEMLFRFHWHFEMFQWAWWQGSFPTLPFFSERFCNRSAEFKVSEF